jgi:hypothetical protein
MLFPTQHKTIVNAHYPWPRLQECLQEALACAMSNCQPLAPLASAAPQNRPTALRPGTHSEPMGPFAADLARLKRPFHISLLEYRSSKGITRFKANENPIQKINIRQG